MTTMRVGHGRGVSNDAATREFLIRSILVTRTGQTLTPYLIDALVAEIVAEMERGPCAWAFHAGRQSRSTERPPEGL
jgi:hypothetical protein